MSLERIFLNLSLSKTDVTLSSRTRSNRCLLSGLMSFNIRAMMMSKPLLSWLAIAVYSNNNNNNYRFKSVEIRITCTTIHACESI